MALWSYLGERRNGRPRVYTRGRSISETLEVLEDVVEVCEPVVGGASDSADGSPNLSASPTDFYHQAEQIQFAEELRYGSPGSSVDDAEPLAARARHSSAPFLSGSPVRHMNFIDRTLMEFRRHYFHQPMARKVVSNSSEDIVLPVAHERKVATSLLLVPSFFFFPFLFSFASL